MNLKRIISRLYVKGENLVKGINLKGLKILENLEIVLNFIIKINRRNRFFDTVAPLYGRNNPFNIVEKIYFCSPLSEVIKASMKNGYFKKYKIDIKKSISHMFTLLK